MTPIEFYTQECLECHAALDTVAVPRWCNDERMSTAQRVQALVTAYRALMLTKATIATAQTS